jgi:hypothetical protein
VLNALLGVPGVVEEIKSSFGGRGFLRIINNQ